MTRLPVNSRLVGPALACALLASPAFSAFTGVSVVQNATLNAAARAALVNAGVAGGENAVVFRIYATFDGPGDGLNNTIVSTGSVNIQTLVGVSFYQDPFGSALPPNELFFPAFPALQFDSYGTIGAFTLGDGGNIMPAPNTEETLRSYAGGWFTGNPQSHIGAAIAQPDLNGGFGTLLFQFTALCSDQSSTPPFVGAFAVSVIDPNNPATPIVFGPGQFTPPCPTEIASSPNEKFTIVNGADLAALLTQWGPAVVCGTTADFNFDGQVNGADLAMLLANWSCSP